MAKRASDRGPQFVDIGEILEELVRLFPVKRPRFKTMVASLAEAVEVAGCKDVSARLAEEARIPIGQARAVVRGLREMAKMHRGGEAA